MSNDQKPWERVAHGVMDVVGTTAQKVFGHHAKPALDSINQAYDEKEKDRTRNAQDEYLRASFQELARTEQLYADHSQELKALTKQEQFQGAPAAEKEAALKELYARQEAEKEDFFKAQEEHNKAIFKDLEQQRALLDNKEYNERLQLHEMVSQERADELRAREALLEQRRQETEVLKPAFEDVERAEAARRAFELQKLDEDHQKTLDDARAALDNAMARGMEQAEAERRLAELAERLAAEREAKIKEQQERMDRFADLYGRDR
jgi:fused signal recognition particle receptor